MIKKIIFIIVIIAVGLGLYGKYVEVNNLKVKEYTINNSKLPDEFKELTIVHFSDILYQNEENRLEDLITNINLQNPDIVVFTGDLFHSKQDYNKATLNYLKDNFEKIDASLFKFAIIGDNDKKFIDEYKDLLYDSDFILLDNENKYVFYKDNTPINIIGLNDVNKFSEIEMDDIECAHTILLTHEPDSFSTLKEYNVDTILAGHSLGGTINLPFYGGLIKKDGANTYINDYYKSNNKEMFISNGIGFEKYNFRLFNSPSINVYRFTNN